MADSNDWANGAPADNGGAGQPLGDGIPNGDEATLANLINQYRMQNGLAAIPISKSLTQVAQAHVRDLSENHPDQGTDGRGYSCNLHSWSAQGNWSPVCYTDDHQYAQGMWSKPGEITNNAYSGNGYEIAFVSSEQVQPEAALASWQSSSAHNAVILEGDIWAGKNWPAFGVGIYGNYAVAWFGDNPEN
ncbi:CAP domain-containing protein [Aerosakkonemataceae cyanobacterium BLCC-F50]|uniref:CAP domain-containing protein n=1 Tax=Floridaenema flaviceps BLCC-F50 TaxID=3153642 RepID=A0ABV4XUU2_9CYAN